MRSKIIGIFLAVLELLRHHGFRAEQSADFAEILVLPPLSEGDARTTVSTAPDVTLNAIA